MQCAARIADRFCESRDPETIERRVRFENAMVLVFLLHVALVLAVFKFQEFERAHPRVITDVDVAFLYIPPPPESTVQYMEVPPKIDLHEGARPAPPLVVPIKPAASLASAKKPTPIQIPVATSRPPQQHVPAAPVAITPLNEIKKDPGLIAAVPVDRGAAGGTDASNGVENGTGTGPGTGIDENGGVPIEITKKLSSRAGMIDISHYRADLLFRIAKNWHPKRATRLVVLLEIAKDGHLIAVEILQSSGNRKIDRQAREAIQQTELAPLPELYQGESMPFKIDLSKTEL